MKKAASRFGLPRWGRWVLGILAVLLMFYAALGFVLVPRALRAKLPGKLGQLLDRPVSVGDIRLNPFTLDFTVDDFAVRERDGAGFAGWGRLHLRLGWSTLVSRTVNLRELELVRPYGNVVLEKGGRLNFSDLVARLGTGQAAAPAPAAPARILRIGRLAIQDARIHLQDRALDEPFATTLGPLTLDLEGFSTEPARDTPYQFSGRTEAGESFQWKGDFSLAPLASRGNLRIDRLRLPKYQPFLHDSVAFRLAAGLASARAGYRFQWSQGVHLLKLEHGELDLEDLQVAPERGPAALELPRAELRGLEADLMGRSAQVASLRLRDGRVQLTRGADGALDLVKLLTPLPRPKPKPAEPSGPFQLQVRELSLEGFRVAYEDRATVRPVRIQADQLDLGLKDFSLDPAGRSPLTLSARLGGKARLRAEGTVEPLRPAVDLKLSLDGLDLPPFDPYLAPGLAVRLNRGVLSLAGRLQAVFAGKPRDFTAFQGDLKLEGFQAADAARMEPFLGYKRLTLGGIDLRTDPGALSIRKVDLEGPDYRLAIAPDGSTNVARALRLDQPAPAAGAAPQPPLSAVGSALPPSQGPAFRLRILDSRMSGGRLSFVDRSLEPNAALLITNLEGRATSLSTEPDSQSAVDFKGLAGGLAPLHLYGKAMPLRKDQDTDVNFTIQSSELQDFSPYAGKFLGYVIRKGKLDVDAHVRIQHRQLDALLRTRLDQFYLGDKTGSPDATHLPVKLALAVLRDRKGVIDLELPVEGNLDDPNFRYGRIVWKAITNVLAKVATAPFALLAKLGGGGEERDLSFVGFEPGSARPGAEAAAKVQSLAKALAERPALGLEAEGSADPAQDTAAMKRWRLEQLLSGLKRGALRGPDEPPLPVLPPEERGPWLLAAYRRAFPEPAAQAGEQPGTPAAPPPPPAEMEQKLLGTFLVTPDDLTQLADRRSKALLKMLRDAQVDPGRLFEVSASAASPHPAGPRVYLGLR